jgi:hypothetical protein
MEILVLKYIFSKNFHLNQLKLEEHLNMCICFMNVNMNLDPLLL